MTEPAIIDLGIVEVATAAVVAPAGRRTRVDDRGDPALRRRRTRHRVRFALAAVAALGLPVATAVQSGSLPPPFGPVGVIRALPSQTFQLFPDGVYVIADRGGHGTAVDVTAYRPDGTRRWRVTLRGAAQATAVYETAGQAVVASVDVHGVGLLAAMDRTTGRRLWVAATRAGTIPTYVIGLDTAVDRLLVVSSLTAGDTAVKWMDTTSGRDLWTVPVPAGWYFDPTAPSVGGMFRAVGPAGQLLEVGLTDAGPRRQVTLEPPPGGTGAAPPGAGPVTVTVGIDAVAVTYPRGNGSVIGVYDPVTYALRWGEPTAAATTVERCGPELCMRGSIELDARDPINGATLWRLSAGTTGAFAMGGELVLPPDTTVWPRYTTMIDIRTGSPTRATPGWAAVGAVGDDRTLVLTSLARAGGSWIGRLDATADAVHPLGRVAGLSGYCTTAGVYLACALDRGTVEVWRIPAPTR